MNNSNVVKDPEFEKLRNFLGVEKEECLLRSVFAY